MNKKGQFDFGWNKPVKIRPAKIPKLKIDKFHITNVGDRTLTPAQKRKLKESVRYKCSRCHKKFESRLLEIHHKKSVSSHKNKLTGVDLPIYSMGKKYIPAYDRRKSNLEVVCVFCHDKTKKRKKKLNNLYGVPYNSKSLFG
jgi:hypothetical protein